MVEPDSFRSAHDLRRLLMRKVLIMATVMLFGLPFWACQDVSPTATDLSDKTPHLNISGVAHHASVGGADFCTALGFSPGCDANFSFTANEFRDGSVEGQWEDVLNPAFIEGVFPVHIAIDCLEVDGNQAWVSGEIVKPDFLAGIPAITRVADNGNSVNDQLDQISATVFDSRSCETKPDLALFELSEGQVTVR